MPGSNASIRPASTSGCASAGGNGPTAIPSAIMRRLAESEAEANTRTPGPTRRASRVASSRWGRVPAA